ncbi:MAG: transglycosylase SLT domain-containing protein [Candidatus Nucleicultricaceae bacterium]
MLNFKKVFYLLSFGCLITQGEGLYAFDCTKALKNPLSSEWQSPEFKQRCALASKIATWMILREGKQGTFNEYAVFIRSNPNWPWEHKLRRNAEDKMGSAESMEALRAFYKESAPKSLPAATVFVDRLVSSGNREEATRQIRRAWQEIEGSSEEQKSFFNKYHKVLRNQDHEARLVLLVKAENFKAAEKVAACIQGPRRTQVEALLQTLVNKKDMPDFSKLKLGHHDDWVVFQYVRQLRRQYDTRAEQILIRYPQYTKSFPDLWWRERSVLSRRALEKGDYNLAYKVVKNHHLQPGGDFAEAEFFLGWVALRFLGQPKVALHHFQTLHDHVKSPISLAKANYWLGRTFEQMGHHKQSHQRFLDAAQYKTTYYGQIAQRKLMTEKSVLPLKKIQVTEAHRRHFESKEFVRAARLFVSAGMPKEALSFLHLLAKRAKNDADRFLAIQLTHAIAKEYVVDIVREVTPHIETAYVEAYPKLPNKFDYQGVDPDFVHAVIRRESGFNPSLISDKDAQGLMQVLPNTCKNLASKHNFKYDPLKLLNDPQYNVKVGSIFLKRLLDNYKGSYIMTLAAYNAGPKPVQEWVQYFGDPRARDIDAIDWVEKISYRETRDYVQRVLEAYVVYKYYRK